MQCVSRLAFSRPGYRENRDAQSTCLQKSARRARYGSARRHHVINQQNALLGNSQRLRTLECIPHIIGPFGMCKSHLRASRSDADLGRIVRNGNLTLQSLCEKFGLIIAAFAAAL